MRKAYPSAARLAALKLTLIALTAVASLCSFGRASASGEGDDQKKAVPPRYEERIWDALIQVRPPEKLHIVKGFYDTTLDAGLPIEKCSLIHIDCDIYTSTRYVLEKLAEKNLYQDGCVVMFDDWNCNRVNPNMGERRALREFLQANPRWTCSQWFSYGWNGMAFILHDGDV